MPRLMVVAYSRSGRCCVLEMCACLHIGLRGTIGWCWFGFWVEGDSDWGEN